MGQNLAKASPGKQPFEGTRSGAVLEGWLREANLLPQTPEQELVMVNVVDRKTRGNRPLTSREISRALRSLAGKIGGADLVVTLGQQPTRAVRRCLPMVKGLLPRTLALEHPSGKNRNLNDPEVRAAQPRWLRHAVSLSGTE